MLKVTRQSQGSHMHTACGHKKECAMKRNGLSSARVVTFEVTFNFKSAASRESFMETGKF